MKLFIGSTQFNLPDENVLFYNEKGIVNSSLAAGRVFDKFYPDNPDNFKMVDVRGIKHWYNNKYLFNSAPVVEKKVEEKKDQNIVKIRVGSQWFEYPDDQIKSWDSEGNIEWSDKVHWKFLRGRPKKGDEFIPSDESRFIYYQGLIYNRSNNLLFKLPEKYYSDKKVALIGSGSYNHDLIDFSSYDIIVGINQIYKTDIFYKIDVIYHGLSVYDNDFIEVLPDIIIDKKVIFIPKLMKSNSQRISDLLNIFLDKNYNFFWEADRRKECEIKMSSNPLSGIVALEHILDQEPLFVHLYGFSFYTDSYIDGISILPNHPTISNSHNLEKNKKYFLEILNKNNNLEWIK